jgi:NAD(P)-dependent dehydrogenase (short-subunit alcohol dehydrogenase family)
MFSVIHHAANEEAQLGAILDWRLSGKTIVVTGASSGIGAATAKALGDVGANVVLVGRNAERLAATAAAVEEHGGRPHVVTAELTDVDQATGVVGQALDAFGSLDGLVHDASVFDPRPLAETTPESFEQQWRANVAAPLFMTQTAVPHLKPGSAVVLVASTTALVGFPGCSAYTATKGAVISLGRQLAVELAPLGIRVNTLVPGYVRTPMLQPQLDQLDGFESWIVENTPQARIAPPEELATNAVYLLSGLSEYVHGQTLVVDGGWVAR